MTYRKQVSSLALALVIAGMLAVLVFSPAFAGGVEPYHPQGVPLAHPPQQDPTPPPPPPPDTIINNIVNTITQTIQFPFVNLVEALQNAIQVILRRAIEPIQMMFEAVLSLWLENPGILSSGNAALPGWDLIRDAWQFMYSIAVAFWPLTLAVVAAIAAKDAVAASTWGLGDLKQALGTWLIAVILSATSLWWMDLANNLTNAITSYILYNFAGPQFFPGTFMVFFSTILPGLFLAFPLAGIIIIMFLLMLAVTIFIGLTFAIIARLVLMYLLVALGPIAIILGVLPPLRFVTHMWTRGFLLVLALGPVNALLLKMAFNVAQYASSAPAIQAAAAFVGVFGLLSILITINYAVVKGVFGAVIAVAQQTIAAVKTVGQMVVAGALLMSGAGAGAGMAMGGGAAGGAAAGGAGGGGGSGGLGGAAISGAGAAGSGSAGTSGAAIPITAPTSGNGHSPWHPSGRGMSAAGSYLQTTRGPLAGFGALLRAAGLDQVDRERAGMLAAGNNAGHGLGSASASGTLNEEGGSAQSAAGDDPDAIQSGAYGYAGAPDAGTAGARIEEETRAGAPEIGIGGGAQRSALDLGDRQRESGAAATAGIGAGTGGTGTHAARSSAASSASSSTNLSTVTSGAGHRTPQVTEGGRTSTGMGASGALGSPVSASAPPRRANTDAIGESRAAMGFAGEASIGERVAAQSGTARMDGESPANAPKENETVGALGENRAAGEIAVGRSDESGRESGMAIAPTTTGTGGFSSVPAESDDAMYAMPTLSPEADRTLSTLPVGSDNARFQAAQLASHYNHDDQGQVAMALEQAMRTVNEQNGIGWENMGDAMQHGLWSTNEAASRGVPLHEIARQMEPFSGTRDPGEFLAWQITGGGEQFQLPAQEVAYLPVAGPYDYQAGRYVEEQTSSAISYRDAAQMFYAIRDPATAGGGWSKGQQFIGEVNRVSQTRGGDPLLELDRWMQTNAPTRARMLWNIHFKTPNS